MCVFFNFWGLRIPAYGFMIAMGVVVANGIAMTTLKRWELDVDNLLVLEGYSFLGAYIGSKGLYLIVSRKSIEWNRLLDPVYFNDFMKSGFVFYGGLILGVVFVLAAGKIHHIDAKLYARKYIFLVPIMHAFGRLGCFFAGCCYGIPYEGIGAVTFPEYSFALPNVKLFPVQLVEAAVLLLIAGILLYLQMAKDWDYTIETYLLLYGFVRFVLEYLRYDVERGGFWIFSTSQWISLGVSLVAGGTLFARRKFIFQEKGKL